MSSLRYAQPTLEFDFDEASIASTHRLDGNWAPATQGIKYAGSKAKLLPVLLKEICAYEPHTVLDGFSGSTRVSQGLAKMGLTVIATDIADWSYCLATAFLRGSSSKTDFEGLMEHLNHLHPENGWYSDHYGGVDNGDGQAVAADGTRRVWQLQNAMRIDAIRNEISRLTLSPVDEAVCLSALILAADKVDSTVGHYASFLRVWSPRSYNDLVLEVPAFCPPNEDHLVVQGDIRQVITSVDDQYDVLYLDPPYGSNNDLMPSSRVRYAAYYNLWTSLIRDDYPETYGKSNRRVDTSDRRLQNDFEDFRRNPATGRWLALEAIESVLRQATCPVVVISYSTEGRVPIGELVESLGAWGKVARILEVDHKRNVMSAMRWTNDWAKDASVSHKELVLVLER